jgi:hypothetical protein
MMRIKILPLILASSILILILFYGSYTLKIVTFYGAGNPAIEALFSEPVQITHVNDPTNLPKFLEKTNMVILCDVPYSGFSKYEDDIIAFVKNGGILVLYSGEQSYGRGLWEESKLYNLMPIEILGVDDVVYKGGEFAFASKIYSYDNYHIVKPKYGAEVLAWIEYPETPAIVYWRWEKGFVISITTHIDGYKPIILEVLKHLGILSDIVLFFCKCYKIFILLLNAFNSGPQLNHSASCTLLSNERQG